MMKYNLFLSVLFLLAFSCKEVPKTEEKEADKEIMQDEIKSAYPLALQKVFDAHGGLPIWQQQRTLVYEIPKAENPETHTTDLFSRKDRIETPNYDMGFDGQRPWLLNKGKAYEGNVEFYHNLMFYFYAMPFVLADDGIRYEEAIPLNFEGQSYPGIQITYDDGIGTSPKDEYYIHYDPETFNMAWLGYTVTYRTGEDSDNIKWIRYNDWGDFNGLKLPQSISWYNYEGMDIKDVRSTVHFENVRVTSDLKPRGFYDKPQEAQFYSKPTK